MNKIIGYAQFHPQFGEVDNNIDTIKRLAADASAADLLVFPELGLTGYEFKDAAEAQHFAEPFGKGPTANALCDISTTHNMTAIIGYPELSDGKAYNACMMATSDGALHNYRKIHLFSRENDLFEPGDAAPTVTETPAGRVGMMICFDWFFPETARMLAVKGAQIIAHPSNLVLQFCQRAMYARSVENRVFTITANRIGTEDRAGRSLTFTGASQILDPQGNTLGQAPDDLEGLALAQVEVTDADQKVLNEHNHLLNDRRTALYTDLTR